ncbi:MAG: serine hydrolase [Acidobacteriota bacterium]
MKIRHLVTLFLILTIFASVNILPKEKFIIEKFKKYINKSLKEWNVPGIAVGIMHNGYIILGEGFGFRDLEKKLPVTRYTLFPIGSSTKAFTSFVAGKLVDEKVIGWDDPVKKYLKEFELYDPWVTSHFRVIDLLTHNSGLPRHDLTWYGSEKSREDLVKGLKYLQNNKGFRTDFQYQNLMYMTAGYLSGQVKGSTWEDLVREYIFTPLEMEGSNFSIEESEKTDNYAFPYIERDGKIIKIPFYREMKGVGPAGSINSNIYEMLKWVKLQLYKGKWDDKVVISEKNLSKIHTPHSVAGETIVQIFEKFNEISYPAYGLGWFIQHYRGNTLIHHGGNIDGFSALVTFMPDIEAGIVVLTNKGSNLLTYATAFHIYDKLRGLKKIDWNGRLKTVLEERNKKKAEEAGKAKKEKKYPEGDHSPLDRLTGNFNHPAYGNIIVSQKDGKLFVKFNNFESSLKHSGGNEFFLESGNAAGMEIKFIKNNGENITALSAPLEPKVENIIFTKK